jgi:hypothetical protein
VRAGGIAAQSGMDERAAKKAAADSDRERDKFLRRFYDVGHELPTHYDRRSTPTTSLWRGRRS